MRARDEHLDALHLDFPVPSRADDLGQAVGIVGVALVDLQRQGGPSVTRVQAHHRQLEGAQLVHQPGRQRAALQPDPLERGGPGRQRLGDRPGEVAQLPRQVTNPRSSTMHTVVLACETSNPVKVGMAALRFG